MLPFFIPRSVSLLGRPLLAGAAGVLGLACLGAERARAQPEAGGAGASGEQPEGGEKPFYIRQYKVVGASQLKRIDVEGAVYPFMGPSCRSAEVEQARGALEQAYRREGYSLVTVSVPPQEVKFGVVTLEVAEGKVGRLRVRGAKYFLPEQIKRGVASLQPGKVPNFDQVKRDILALNRHPDRQVVPDVKPGVAAGTWDVDLKVEDQSPLHGSLEFNNRYSPDTTEWRVNGAVSYANLWQAGHTVGFNFQVAPERIEDAAVYSGFYTLPLSASASFSLTGTKQDSDINTLGGSSVGGRGYVVGGRVNFTLPTGPPFSAEPSYYHSLGLGVDFKHFDEDVTFAGQTQATPIEYFPFSLSYGGTWVAKAHSSDINASLTYGLRGLGSDAREFDAKRFLASGGFVQVRGDVAHTHDLPGGMEVFAKVQGQLANQPLINSEQASGGGLGNARGYLESTVLGDNAVFGSLEWRSPSLLGKGSGGAAGKADAVAAGAEDKENEWRFHAFVDAGYLSLNDVLPEQDDHFSLLSVGAGTRLSLQDHFHASLDAGVPLRAAGVVEEGDWLLTFRLWTDF